MAKIKDTASIAEKWARVTPQRVDDYKSGVENPRVDWEQATRGAEKNYEAGVTEAIRSKRFGKGVQDAGTEKWQSAAAGKGAQRWPTGVAGAADEFQSGFDKFRNVIANTNLPPRFPKGDPRNLERVKVMSQALRKAKVG